MQPCAGEGVEATVEPGGEIFVWIEDGHIVRGHAEAGYGDEPHEGPVANEQHCGDGGQRAGAAGDEADEAGDEVADGDAGEHSEDAQVGEVEVREGAEEHLDGEDGDGAAKHVEGERALAVASCDAGVEGQDDGDADEEEEVGEDEVGEGEAVPCGVVELRVDVAPVAGIVDEDHEGDGEAAEDVDGEDALRSGLGDGVHGRPSY